MAVNDLSSSVDATFSDDPNDASVKTHQQDHDVIHGWLKTAGDISAPVLTGNSGIADLTNVTITTVADNEILSYDTGTGTWINQTPAEIGIAASTHSHSEADILDLDHYTSSDFTVDFGTKSTTDLTEGTRLYYTTARANSAIDVRVTKIFVDALNVDADTLDGSHASAFAVSGHDHNTAYSALGHGHVIADVSNLQASLNAKEDISDKGVAGGYAPLDAQGLIPASTLPPIAVGETFSVASEAAMLAVNGQIGDVAIRTDTDTRWLLVGTDPSILNNWRKLDMPADIVETVTAGTGITITGQANTTISLAQATIDDINSRVVANPAVIGATRTKVTYDSKGLVTGGTTLAATDIPSLDTGKITTGTFANARISAASVTQHQAALSITESQISNLSHLTIEQVQDNLGTAFVVGGSDITVAYDDTANTLTINSTATGVTDHGALTGLGDDDHTQYLNSARHNTLDHSTAMSTVVVSDISDITITTVADNEVLAYNSGTATWINQTAAEAGLATSGHDHNAIYYTETEINNFLTGKSDTSHAHDAVYVNEADHTKAAHDALNINADTVDGQHASAFAVSSHNHDGTYAPTHAHPYASDTHNHDSAYVNANAAITAGTSTKITYDAKGLVTGGTSLVAADIPSLDTAKITTGTFVDARIPNLATTKITTGTFAVARGGTGIASYTAGNYINAATTTTLQQRTPAQVLADIGAATSGHNHDATYVNANTSITGGTFPKVTFDSKGLVTAGAALVDMDIPNLPTSKITTGTFLDARISQSSVTQHQAALSITESQISNLDHLTIEEVQDNLGTAFVIGGTDITAVYDDVANTLTINSTATGVTDHGALTGLGDDDHTQYLNSARHTKAIHDALGINADTVDGQHASAFATSAHTHSNYVVANTAITGATHPKITYDAKGLVTGGAALVAADIPSLDAAKITTGTFVNARISASSVTQHITKTYVDGLNINADTVDGQHASAFATSTHNHDGTYAPTHAHPYVNSNVAITGATHPKITYDSKGLVTGGAALVAADIPSLDATKITTGTFADARIPNLSTTKITAGTLSVARGGTGIASYTTGNYINASGATTLQQRTPAQVLADIGAATSGHNHNTTYYTETETDTLLSSKASAADIFLLMGA